MSLSEQYDAVSRANKVYYSQTAAEYDASETCVVDSRFQTVLTDDLNKVIGLVKGAVGRLEIRVLDACGGSGNVSLKLAKMDGVTATLCDQSAELIDIFVSKSKLQGTPSSVVRQEIAAFLSTTEQKFDLIVFSSALHHLQDYRAVLKLAAGRLNEGGFIFTVFDPIQWKFPARQIVQLDHIVFKLRNGSFFPTVRKKVRRTVLKLKGTVNDDTVNWGKIAEYHVGQGIDDMALAQYMRELGLRIVWHIREPKSRYPFFEGLLRWCGCPTTFKFLFQKACPDGKSAKLPKSSRRLTQLPHIWAGEVYRAWLQWSKWRAVQKDPNQTPLLSYAGLVPDRSRVVSGGNVKLGDLNSIYPEHTDRFNLLYLVSSGINTRAEALARVCRSKNIPLIWNQNGVAYPAWAPEQHVRLNARMARLLHSASVVVYQSRFCRESSDMFLGPFHGESHIIYNAVDTSVFKPSSGEQTRNDPLELLIMGSHQQPGRVEAALETTAQLNAQGMNARLTVAGRLDWQGAEADFKRMCDRAALGDRVRVRGAYLYHEAVDIYHGADILLHLKHADPCPSVVIESMACGVPVVGSGSGGLPELIGDEGGILVPAPQDFEAMYVPAVQDIVEAVIHVHNRLTAYRLSARQRAVKHFDRALWLKKHRAIFEQVLRPTP